MADIRNNFSLNPIGAGGHNVPTRFLDGYLSMKQDQKSNRYDNILQCVQTENGLTSLSFCQTPILEMLLQGSRGPKFFDLSWFIINFQKIKKLVFLSDFKLHSKALHY